MCCENCQWVSIVRDYCRVIDRLTWEPLSGEIRYAAKSASWWQTLPNEMTMQKEMQCGEQKTQSETFHILNVGNRNMMHTLGVVHAHGGVIIDCRVPQESVIRIVSTMGTKESISYKMISHGSWYRQIERERERGRATAKTREEEERESNSQVKRRSRERHSREKKKGRAEIEVKGESV